MKGTSLIQAVAGEKLGYKFDIPQRLGDESSVFAVVPILKTRQQKRKYITFAEAVDIEARDTGQIDTIYVKNNDSSPVYISRGDIFRGKTQERAAIHGYIVEPNSGARIAVRCIHQQKGINKGADTRYGGRVPYEVDLSKQNRTWSTICAINSGIRNDISYENDRISMNPIAYYATNAVNTNAVVNYTSSPEFNSTITGDSDLVGALDRFRSNLKDVLKSLPVRKNQVGAAIFGDNKILGIDIYDNSESWKAMQDDIIIKEGSKFDAESNEYLFEIRPERANAIIKRALDNEFKESIVYKNKYTVTSLMNSKFYGEAVEYKGGIIHLSLWCSN